MSRDVHRVTKAASKLYSTGLAMPAAAEQALDECEINEMDRRSVQSQVCSILGTRGAREKERLARIRKQSSSFRRRVPFGRNTSTLDPDEQYLIDERDAIQNE